MLSAASSVLPGTVLPEAAALNSPEQALPPLERVHEARALASVSSLPVATVSVDGIAAPGDVPVLALTRLFAVRNALSKPVTLVQLEPTLPPLDMNEASAQTDAAVVTSLTVNELPALMAPQGPTAVMSQRDALAADPEPAWPPFESK
jgi:hypothetical protein